jgi:hypothetical protein
LPICPIVIGRNTYTNLRGGLMDAARKSIFPIADDSWESIAVREMAASDKEQAISQLQSWNLHVFARRVINDDTGEMGNPILPSDVIFVEPPVKA